MSHDSNSDSAIDRTRSSMAANAADAQAASLAFDSAEAAHTAYVDAKRRLHEGCTL